MIVIVIPIYDNIETCVSFLDRHYEFFTKYNVKLVLSNNDNSSVYERTKKYSNLIIRIINDDKNYGYFGAAREALLYLKNTYYEYFILSNVDISLDESYFQGLVNNINDKPMLIAPNITSNLTGMPQNPLYRKKPKKIKMRLLSFSLCSRYLYAFYKILGAFLRREKQSQNDLCIYAVHGSNIIVNYQAIQCGVDFSHCGFLFGEEISLAEKVAVLGVEIKFLKSMKLTHFEHDSTGNIFRSKIITDYHKSSIDSIIRAYY